MLVRVLNGINKDFFVRVIPSRLKTFVLTLTKIFAILRCIPVRPLKQCLSILEEDVSVYMRTSSNFILRGNITIHTRNYLNITIHTRKYLNIYYNLTLITLWVVSLVIQFQLCHISLYHIILINVLSTLVTKQIYHVLERVKKYGEQCCGKNFSGHQQQQEFLILCFTQL